MQSSPELLQFAEVCLGRYFTDFTKIVEDFQTLDVPAFREKYPIFEDLCYSPKSYESLDELEDLDEDEIEYEIQGKDTIPIPFLLLFYAFDKKLMARVDWSGEDETGEVAEAVKHILNNRSVTGFEWDTEKFMESLDWSTIQRGDFIPILFKAIDAELQKIDHRLAIFFMGDDSYPFTVLSTADFNKVHRLAWSFYAVQGVDTLGEYRPMGGIFQNRVRAVVQFFRRFTG